MRFYRGEDACYWCGLVDFTAATCPRCKFCVYCKKEGHLVADCRKAPPCRICGQKGHKSRACGRHRPMRPRRTISKGAMRSIKPRVAHSSDAQVAMSLSVKPRKHDEENWAALPKGVRDCVSLQPPAIFPDLKDLCIRMLQDVVDGKLPGSQCFPYKAAIEAYGGIDPVTGELLHLINLEVKCLQGQEITPGALDSIRSKQTKPWPLYAGYLDYVTEDRCKGYLRPYVGQSINSPKRIIRDHSQSILQNKTNTLHYFIIWLGNGHRSGNFLRLWSDPTREWNDWSQMRFNLLEALFCCAFYSHHGSVAPAPFNPATSYSGLGYGLNIISPLMQNASLSLMDKLGYTGTIANSDDPQIREWLSYSHKIKNDKIYTTRGPLLRNDYYDALQRAVGMDTFQALQALFKTPTQRSPQLNQGDLDATMFYGSLSAPVGFILDYGITKHSDLVSPCQEESSIDLPWVLDGFGFNHTNVLVWTTNFQRFSALSPSGLLRVSASDDIANLQLHQSILKASQLKVLLMCGPRAEEKILALGMCEQRYTLEIRGYKYHLYIGNGDSNHVTRLYIRCPELPLSIWAVDGSYASKVCEIVKLATLMNNVEGISPYFLEASTALSAILRQAWREKGGAPKMTTDTLTTGLQLWLARKGFLDEDIRKLEEITGSLTKGLLVLMQAFPRRPGGSGAYKGLLKQSKRKYDHLDREIYEASKRHCQEVLAKREAKFDKVFSTSEPSARESQAPVTMISEFFAASDDNSAYIKEVQELLLKQQKGFLAGPHQQAFPEPQQIKDLLGNQEPSICELERLAELMDLKGGLTIAEGYSVSAEEYSVYAEEYFDSAEEDSDPAEEYSESVKFRPYQRKNWKTEHRNWYLETGNFQGKKYLCVVPNGALEGHNREISLCHCRISIPDEWDVGDGRVHVSIEICAEDESHPEAYAVNAVDEDISRRLAFRITMKDSAGKEFEKYAKSSGRAMVFRANSFVDILLYGKAKEDIAKTPRRYVHYKKGSIVPKGLEKFVGGGYTS